MCAVIAGISQPMQAVLIGRMTDDLLQAAQATSSPVEPRMNYENVYLFLGIGLFVLVTGFLQVIWIFMDSEQVAFFFCPRSKAIVHLFELHTHY